MFSVLGNVSTLHRPLLESQILDIVGGAGRDQAREPAWADVKEKQLSVNVRIKTNIGPQIVTSQGKEIPFLGPQRSHSLLESVNVCWEENRYIYPSLYILQKMVNYGICLNI